VTELTLVFVVRLPADAVEAFPLEAASHFAMIIDNVEALRSWLTDKLRPICDADPSALAKYVVALIKKEKPLNELQEVCADQLDVFLADEIKKFVDELFDVLQTKSYFPSNQLMIPQAANAVQSKTVQENSDTSFSVVNENEDIASRNIPEVIAEDERIQDDGVPGVQKLPEVVPVDKKDSFINEDTNKKKRMSYKNSDASSDRGHTRQHRHSRKDKNFDTIVDEFLNPKKPRSESEGNAILGRSASPGARRSPRRQSPGGGRRYRSRKERRRRSEERRSSRKKQRCRDYDEKGVCLLGNSCPFDHGRDPVVVDDSAIPSILGIPGVGPPALPLVPPSQPVPPIPELFGGVFPSSMIVNPVPSIAANTLSLDTALTLVSGQQRPLPSVAEMPESLPVFAQPQPALTTIQPIVEEGKKSSKKESAENATNESSKSRSGSEAYNPEEPSIDVIEQPAKHAAARITPINQAVTTSQTRLPNSFAQYPPTTITAEQFLQKMYIPSSAMLPPPVLHPSLPNAVNSILQRNLLNLSTVHSLTAATAPPAVPVPAPKFPVASTSAPSVAHQPPVAPPARRPFMNQTILEIRKIPFEANSVVKLSEYFQKFGNIVNIQVSYENDPQAALIQFSNNAEARKAYSSPEAVLGNRFIKIFWHNKTKELPPMTSQANVLSTQNSLKTSTLSSEANSKQVDSKGGKPKLPSTGQTTYVNPQNTPEAMQKKQAEVKKDVLKKKLEIQKQRQQLLEKQIKEQKVLINKLEKNKNISASEKQCLMTALKTLTGSIEKLKTDLETQAKAAKPKSKQALEKELLDREIELYNKQCTADDLTISKKAMADLQKETGAQQASKPIPIGRGRGRGRGRGMYRGRGFAGGRAGSNASRVMIDNRPKQLLVTGYEEKDKEGVVAQFASYGEIDRVEEKAVGKLVLSFHSRKQAEIAASKAAVFNGKLLVLAWYNAVQHTKRSSTAVANSNQPSKIQRRDTRGSSVSSLLEEDREDVNLLEDFDDKEADLLLLEEDEEEDVERSWKR